MKRCLPLFLLCVPLFASWECDYCYHAEGGVEAIYWKPCSTGFEYGQAGKNQLILSPDYGWGFRLFASVSDQNRCNVIGLDYTQLQTTSTVDIGRLSIKARERIRYNKISLKVGRKLGCLYGYVGGRYVEFFDKRMAFATTNTVQQARLEAGGVEMGLWGHAPVWCGFGVSGRITLLAVIGKHASDFFEGGVRTHVNPRRTECISGYEFRFGVDYTYCCKRFSVKGEVGYEFNQYLDAVTVRKSNVNVDTNFGFGGPYASLTFGF